MAGLTIQNHPCFNEHARGKWGRIHLPVAPHCNIRCNYCNRKHDCVNESRPGVTSTVLRPRQALEYLEQVTSRMPNISVAGIAGPGDAFADPPTTLETLRLVRERFPKMLLCLATNGLNVAPHISALAELQVSHVTMTVNAVDPVIGSRIYPWVRNRKVIYRGLEAAAFLMERQIDAITGLKKHGILVKVNTIVIPGVNDDHVPDIASKVAELGAEIQNCMPMYPNAGTPFEAIPEPTPELIAHLRNETGKFIQQMKHCMRCRADAVGLLDDDKCAEFRECLSTCSKGDSKDTDSRPYVAVASMEGMLVNQHLGEARRFHIWACAEDGYQLIEQRDAPERGTGTERWHSLTRVLCDCRAVLVSGLGETPKKVLEESGILPIQMTGFIQRGLEAIYGGADLSRWKGRRQGCSKGSGCSGDAMGCG